MPKAFFFEIGLITRKPLVEFEKVQNSTSKHIFEIQKKIFFGPQFPILSIFFVKFEGPLPPQMSEVFFENFSAQDHSFLSCKSQSETIYDHFT